MSIRLSSRKSICSTGAGYSSVAVGGRFRGVTLIEGSMNHVVIEELINLFMGVDTGLVMLVKLYAS